MPRIKKTEVEVAKPVVAREKNDEIQIKRIHRRTAKKVETPKEVVVPISSLLPVEEIKEIESIEDPRIEEISNPMKTEEIPDEVSDEIAQQIKEEFLNVPQVESTKDKIQKIEKEVKTPEQKKEEVTICRCSEPDFEFTPFMTKFLNYLFFVFASTTLIGLNLTILTFFAWLIACMFH